MRGGSMPEQPARCCTSALIALKSNLSITNCVVVSLCFTNASPVISRKIVCFHRLAQLKFIQVIDNDICGHSLSKMASVEKTSSHCRKLAQLPVGFFQLHELVFSYNVN